MKVLVVRVSFIVIFMTILTFTGKKMRSTLQATTVSQEMISELPVSMQVGSVALGPLKGLLVDMLWWRSERMLEDREFFEALQLTEWITSMQPTYPSVWNYQGFNLAFNISQNFTDYDERWNWVHEGIKLLRDKGLRYNPDWGKNRDIRFELVHIFYRKLEENSDPESRRFQDIWTLEMLNYFDKGDRQELEELASAPKNLDSLFQLAEIKKLEKSLAENGVNLRVKMQVKPFTWEDLRPDTAQNYDFNRAVRKIIFCNKRMAIEKELNMDVERILKIDQNYGPFDWRTHQAQIVYWGVEEDYDKFKLNSVNYGEFVRAAMLSSFYNGKIVFSEKKDYFMRSNNIEILPKLHNFFDFLLYESGLDEDSPEYQRIDNIHKDFLERAIVITFSYNQMAASEDLFEHYKNYLPEDDTTTFEQYVIRGFTRTLTVVNHTTKRSLIESIMFKAYEDAARGEWDRYHGYLRVAQLMHKAHQLENKDIPSYLLPPFKEIASLARKKFLESTGKTEKQVEELENEAGKFSNPKILPIH